MKPNPVFQPHLVIKHIDLPPAREWKPESPGWVFVHVTCGQAYAMHPQKNQQVEKGSVVAFAHGDLGYVRASQLDWTSLHFFRVDPERLSGLLTLWEQRSLNAAAKAGQLPPSVFAADHPVSAQFRKLCPNPKANTFSVRLQLLEIFTEVVGNGLKTNSEEIVQAGAPMSSARVRITELLKEMPAAALLDLTLSELVKEVRCTPRHISRVFNEMVGMSFRKKQNEVRLQRAQELLATTDGKVLEVAMESGFQSLTLFNLMFKRKFGVTPGKWREKVKGNNISRPRRVQRLIQIG